MVWHSFGKAARVSACGFESRLLRTRLDYGGFDPLELGDKSEESNNGR